MLHSCHLFSFTCYGGSDCLHDALYNCIHLLVSQSGCDGVTDSSFSVFCCGPFIFFCRSGCGCFDADLIEWIVLDACRICCCGISYFSLSVSSAIPSSSAAVTAAASLTSVVLSTIVRLFASFLELRMFLFKLRVDLLRVLIVVSLVRNGSDLRTSLFFFVFDLGVILFRGWKYEVCHDYL